MKLFLPAVAAAGLGLAGLTAAGCMSAPAAPAAHVAAAPRPAVTITHTAAPSPAVTVTRTASPAAVPVPAAPQPLADAEAVVDQFYQDITNQDYPDAWTLGGVNIGGLAYPQWVAGYDTTASITLGTVSNFDATTVQAEIIATQDDGTVKTYQGTYTVTGGVITAADIVQVS